MTTAYDQRPILASETLNGVPHDIAPGVYPINPDSDTYRIAGNRWASVSRCSVYYTPDHSAALADHESAQAFHAKFWDEKVEWDRQDNRLEDNRRSFRVDGRHYVAQYLGISQDGGPKGFGGRSSVGAISMRMAHRLARRSCRTMSTLRV